MGLFGRLARLIRANIDDLTGDGRDPEKKLDQAIAEMGARLIETKNLVAASVAEEARLAALGEKSDSFVQQQRATQDLKRALVLLNDKIEEAKARRATLRLRSRTAQVTEAVHSSTGGIESESVSDLLDRLETQVEHLEMQARVSAELGREAQAGAPGRLPARAPVVRELGPVSAPAGEGESAHPVEPGDEKRTGR